jgi:hypothetical protein
MTIAEVKKHIQAQSKDKIILYVGAKIVSETDENVSLKAKYPEADYNCQTMGFIEVSYKTVVFC